MTQGYADFYGFHPAASGWFFCGWIPVARGSAVSLGFENAQARITFDGSNLAIKVAIVPFERDDLKGGGVGIVLFARHAGRFQGRMLWIELDIGGVTHRLDAASGTAQLRETELIGRLRMVLGTAFGEQRGEVAAMITRRGYTGADTIESLVEPVRIGIDDAIVCQPDGLLIIGWMLAAPDAIVAMHLCCNGAMTELDRTKFLPISRRDVSDGIGAPLGIAQEHCGFATFVQTAPADGAPVYLQVETRNREAGYHNLSPRRLPAMTAIRRLLDIVDVEYDAVRPVFDAIVGPSVGRLNTERLRAPPGVTETQYGRAPANPSCSVIVPLYGRVDYLEYQLALMSADPEAKDFDIIYVLDDPPRRRESQLLAESAYQRFQLPFRLLAMDENRGYAPANNVGLKRARARHLCFLNSDVFPKQPGWLGRLCGDLAANPDIGAVGGLLVFEDGSVQHEGMRFEPIPVMGGYHFPIHTRKGWRPKPGMGLARTGLITGACMVMDTDIARRLGGFDEAYVIGDFEDTDLCAKLRTMGKTCAVDHDVTLYHLERRSQVSPDKRWRMNLTLYNAWLHEHRWFAGPVSSRQANDNPTMVAQ